MSIVDVSKNGLAATNVDDHQMLHSATSNLGLNWFAQACLPKYYDGICIDSMNLTFAVVNLIISIQQSYNVILHLYYST